MIQKKKLLRDQLDASLKQFTPLVEAGPPARGWVRTIRNALGMTAKQLACRLGIAQQAVSRIEKQELKGAVTFKTMRRIGEALDCVFVYGFVPRASLEETVARQARLVAEKRLEKAAESINPKNRALTVEEKEKVISNLADALLQTLPPTFWNPL